MDALADLRDRGFKVMVHSCNNPGFIREMCREHGLVVDAIWGESPQDRGQKPVCSVYIDDRAVGFRGDWPQAIREALALMEP